MIDEFEGGLFDSENPDFIRAFMSPSLTCGYDGHVSPAFVDNLLGKGKRVVVRLCVNLPWPAATTGGSDDVRVCRNGIPANAQKMMSAPFIYQHGPYIAFERDYNDARFIEYMLQWLREICAILNADPRVVAVELGIFGQYGEFTTYLFNITRPLFSVTTFRTLILAAKSLLPNKHVLVRWFEGDPGTCMRNVRFVGIEEIFDDTVLHPNSAKTDAQIAKYVKGRRPFNGGEVLPEYQELALNLMFDHLVDVAEKRGVCYLCLHKARPQNDLERRRLEDLRDLCKRNARLAA